MSARTFEPNHLRGLNPAQRDAVTTSNGPLLVLAGAGTGKTRVITHRLANLLAMGVPPSQILAVTFTNKAAREMRERVGGILGKRPSDLLLSTFHSLGMRILRAEAEAIGYRSNFTIYDTADQLALLKTILREFRAGAAVHPRAAREAISRAKSAFQLPDELLAAAAGPKEELIAHAYGRYRDHLRDLNAVDFDDLILLPVMLLRTCAEAGERYRRRWRFISVDEYQDTNSSQYHFLRALVGPERNLCVVGDDDQSIYGFRGAEVDKILRFEKDFPGAKVVKLEENYRSSPRILSLANAVMAASANRHPKALRTSLPPGPPVRWLEAEDDAHEADYIVRQIASLLREEGAPPETVAVLMRSAAQARPFEEKLRLRGIPYTVVGGQSYFDRKEIRDVLAYWKAAANPRDEQALLRIANVPRRGLGSSTLRALADLARERRVPLLEGFALAAGGAGDFSDGVRAATGKIAELFAAARAGLARRDFSAAATRLLEGARYRDALDELYAETQTRQTRWNAVEDLLRSVERWAGESPADDFSDFLRLLTLEEGQEGPPEERGRRRGVCLMTLHSAKGLEFQHVFLAGVEEGLLPHHKSAAEGERSLDEERRLFYVGITRARRSLTLSSAGRRTLQGRPRRSQPSRFLTEVESSVSGQAGDRLLEHVVDRPGPPASEAEVQAHLAAFRRRREGSRPGAADETSAAAGTPGAS